MKKILMLILLLVSNVTYAENEKHPLLIKGIGLGEVKLPCKPRPVKFESSYDGHIEKILLKCSVTENKDSIEITFSSDGKKIVRVLRQQYLTAPDPEPVDVMNAAIKFYGNPNESKANTFAIYGDAHTCNKCVTDMKANDFGKGLLVCISSGWNIGRRTFHNDDSGVVYELIDMPAFLKANTDGEKTAEIHNKKVLSEQKF